MEMSRRFMHFVSARYPARNRPNFGPHNRYCLRTDGRRRYIYPLTSEKNTDLIIQTIK